MGSSLQILKEFWDLFQNTRTQIRLFLLDDYEIIPLLSKQLQYFSYYVASSGKLVNLGHFFGCVLLDFKKDACKNSHIFTRPPNIHITTFHTKNNFKRNNMHKKPSHSNNMHKKPSHTTNMHKKPSHTTSMHRKPSDTNNMDKKPSHTNNLHKKPSHTNNMYKKPSHTNNMYIKSSHKSHLTLTIRMKNHHILTIWMKNHRILTIRMKTILQTTFIKIIIQTLWE